ncbi:helix-turn-helix domain-containing protein [Xanthobacter autotrophicus DSM 431]|uniref:GlxA family transcriptional regulator n=1 Tax=Xanthobacter nonsaccharivorans TaxID=3119912 RepID=UPI00372C3681
MNIVVVGIDGCLASGFLGFVDVLSLAREVIANYMGEAPFEILTASEDGRPVMDGHGRRLEVDARLDEIASTSAVLVPGQVPQGLRLPDMSKFRPVAEWIRYQHARGSLACGSCGGVYLLGEAGLLNDRRCTTTWWLHDELRRRYPRADAAWGGALTDDGGVITAGGALSWTDISLHVVRCLCGTEAARIAADFAVVDTTPSSQAVYIPAGHLAESNPFLLEAERAVRHVRGRRMSTSELAERLALSERTLHRRLQALAGESPKRFIDRVRFEMARTMLDAGTMSIKQIAQAVGFEDDSSFRKNFRHFAQMTPTAYRARVRV